MDTGWTETILAEVSLPGHLAQIIDYHFDPCARITPHTYLDTKLRWRVWPDKIRLRAWADGGIPTPGGKLMFIPACSTLNVAASDEEESTKSLSLGIRPEWAKAIIGEEKSRVLIDAAMCSDFRHPKLENAMRCLASEIEAPGLCSRLVLEACCLFITAELISAFNGRRPTPSSAKGLLSARRVKQIEEFVLGYEFGVPTPTEIAAELNIGVSRLRQIFKESTGKTLFRFVEDVRVDRAKSLLGDRVLPLKEVAYRLGFATPSAFSLAFKRATGTTPGDYRLQCGNRQASFLC